MKASLEFAKKAAYVRYANVVLIVVLLSEMPMPLNRIGLALCCGAVLVANGVLHIYLLRTSRHRSYSLMSLIVDLLTISTGIYFSGSVSSPFVIILPITFFSMYFVNLDKRMTIFFGVGAIAIYAALFILWWILAPDYSGWSPGKYPGFALFVFAVHVSALASYVYLAVQLNPLVEVLARQEAELHDQQRKAELGTSLSVISHEVRTPLSVIAVGTELLAREMSGVSDPDGRLAARIGDIRGAIKHIDDLLGLVLSYAHERRGAYDRKPCAPASIVRKAVDLVRMKHRRERISFAVDPGGEERTSVICDENALFRVLVNLLDNAMKARVPGKDARIGISLARDDGMLVMAVKDNGAGISREKKARVFDRFYTDSSGGTGIGLFVCRSVIEDHGGSIGVDSEDGQGATFFVRLPLNVSGAGAGPGSPLEAAASGPSGRDGS